MKENPDVDIVGSWIAEFEYEPNDIYAHRKTPTSHHKLIHYAKRRNPFNHMSVMFKKTMVMKSGNYGNYRWAQDYHLWVKMILNGAILANIPETLVFARAGQSMIKRRGGQEHFRNEVKMQIEFYKINFISFFELLSNISIRFLVRTIPNKARIAFYNLFLR